MSAEDALYRVMVPVAKNLLETSRRAGEPVEPAVAVDATLQEFGRSIRIEPHLEALRQRLLAHLTAPDRSD